jgi:hypothetical protein
MHRRWPMQLCRHGCSLHLSGAMRSPQGAYHH